MTLILFFIAFTSFLLVILNLLPVASALPSPFVQGFTNIVSNMKAWDAIFPISELLTVVTIVVSVHLAIMFFKFVRWVIHLVRGATN